MQKIFLFEIDTAIKDRPKTFQIITLILFAFSLTMILICSLERLSAMDNSGPAAQKRNTSHYINFASSPSQPLMNLKK